ncbi:MAG: alpha/beta hydrolase family protein [Gammaproteobacteria bacterium]|nr:alpha/beta hydrolase family protein [Gammaproteobacteria bacterium]MDH3448753.1 alpha/beta hydrolase family protein [Gammaproteobacteria bacterium]
MRGPLGGLFTLRWFDPASMVFLRRLYLPLSRLWAVADAAHGSVTRFAEIAGIEPNSRQRQRLGRVLFRFEVSRARVNAADAAWCDAFFAGTRTIPGDLAAIEKARKEAHQAHNLMRRDLRFLLHFKPQTSRYEIPTRAAVETLYGTIRSNPDPYYAAPAVMPAIEQSRPFAAADGNQYWIRFRSPSSRTADSVYARVHEPAGIDNPPTIIYGHGICVEFDYLEGLVDEVDVLCRLGFRVVRPEAPFHGRRRPEGYYGGEYISATSPLGVLDTFTAAVTERAVLMDWCRRGSNGPVTMGGSSLGALIAQLVCGQASNWPPHLRPDALLLIMHCSRIEDALIHGSIARLFGALKAKHERGWSVATVAEYLQALDPPQQPSVDAANIVSVLGESDQATPFAGGLELLDRWQLPPQNRFIWPQGHFSLPIALTRNDAPLRRFRQIVKSLN